MEKFIFVVCFIIINLMTCHLIFSAPDFSSLGDFDESSGYLKISTSDLDSSLLVSQMSEMSIDKRTQRNELKNALLSSVYKKLFGKVADYMIGYLGQPQTLIEVLKQDRDNRKSLNLSSIWFGLFEGDHLALYYLFKSYLGGKITQDKLIQEINKFKPTTDIMVPIRKPAILPLYEDFIVTLFERYREKRISLQRLNESIIRLCSAL